MLLIIYKTKMFTELLECINVSHLKIPNHVYFYRYIYIYINYMSS